MEPLSCWPPEVEDHENEIKQSRQNVGHEDQNPTLHVSTKSERKKPENVHSARACKKQKLSSQEEAFANIALARWWRSEGRHTVTTSPVSSGNPNTFLQQISSLPDAKSFIDKKIKQLTDVLSLDNNCARIHAVLATFLEKTERFIDAMNHINEALRLDPSDKELQWLQHRIKAEVQVQAEQRRRLKDLTSLNAGLPPSVPVERRAAESLSFQEFFFQFAMTSTPVIITGAVRNMTSVPWTMQHVQEVAGSCSVTMKKLVPGSVNWAQLETAEETTVKQFINNLSEQETVPPEHQRYLFDWSLPLNCPELCEEITIPKHFAGDFLQRSSPGSLYRDSWPSLFIAPKGLRSELHVDAFGSNFWMALFQGRKRWVFFRKEDLPLLYPHYPSDQSTDPVFNINLRKPDLNLYPLLSLLSPRECILQPGELLFVPAGCPHYVENLDQSLAVSSNFVDLSNLSLVRRELAVNGLIDDRAKDLVEQIDSSVFCSKMDSKIQDMSWKDFKSWPKSYHKHDY